MTQNTTKNSTISNKYKLSIFINKNLFLFFFFFMCLSWASLAYGEHSRHYYFECPHYLLVDELEEATRQCLRLHNVEYLEDKEPILISYVDSKEFCGTCLDRYYSDCQIEDMKYIPHLGTSSITACGSCYIRYWNAGCPEPYYHPQGIYAGYVHFLYNGERPFLKKQINYTKKYPKYQAYWPETSKRASDISELACSGMVEIFNSTKLSIVLGNKSLESALPISSPAFYTFGNIVPQALVSNCFRFSDFYQVFYDLSEYTHEYFTGSERREIIDKLDALLDQIYISYVDLYAESMRLHPTQEIAEEIEFMNLYKNILDNTILCKSEAEFCGPNASILENDNAYDLEIAPCHKVKKNSKKQSLARKPALSRNERKSSRGLLTEVDKNEKKETNFLQANLEFMKGCVCSESLLYDQAITHFKAALRHNPALIDAYIECAYAYFELGDIEEALHYYNKIQSKLKNRIKPIAHFRENLSITSGIEYNDSSESTLDAASLTNTFDYSCGLVAGTLRGGKESALDFLPSAFNTLTGIGQGLWAFACSPKEVSSDMIEASYACVDYLSTHSLNEITDDVVPELKSLLKNWNVYSHYEKGNELGYLIGKYGIAIFGPGTAAKVVKNYRSLKRANTMLTLRACTQSKEYKFTIWEKVKIYVFNRKILPKHAKLHWDRQRKHILGEKNFIAGRSVISLQREEIETLIKKFAGKGNRVRNRWGTADYRERVDFGQIIGTWTAEGSNVHLPTTNGTIIYDGKWQMHLIPAKPTQTR